MSFNQPRGDSSQYRRTKRSSSFSQKNSNNFSWKGGGGAAAPPPSANLQPNRSFSKKSSNAQGRQYRARGYVGQSDLNSVSANPNAPNGSQFQPAPAPNVQVPNPVVKTTTEQPAQTSDQIVPNAPSQVTNVKPGPAPQAIPTKDASKSFPIQFGSIPARTSSAPPNLVEQQRDQARRDAQRQAPPVPIPSVPKQQIPRKDGGAGDQPKAGEGHQPPPGFLKKRMNKNVENSDKSSSNRRKSGSIPPGFSKKTMKKNVENSKKSSSNRRKSGSIPPGFSKKTMNKNVENSEKSSSNRRKSGSTSPQLDFPPSGSALHSVSGFEIEETLSDLHSEIGENGEKLKNGDSDDLDDNVVESLEKEEVSSSKNQKKKRDKEYRSDTRGQRVLAWWMRKSRSMIACRTDIDIFNAPLLSIFDSVVPPEEEKMKQKQLLALLEKLVIKEWPEARLHVYGSCANSFGVKKSDIDICLAMKDTDVNKSEILLRLADILEAENFENVQALTHARVPIVKLMDSVTGISCDICINNVLAVVNSKLLRDYAKIDARLRQLAVIVKHWAKSRGVNDTYHGTLSSYAYVLMCIHFLQQCRPSILPCLQGMNITYSVSVDNVECAFFDQVDKLSGFGLRNKENIGQLVWGFFRYWAYCHDYTDVVSVRVGSTISKCAKDWRVGNGRHLICIEDPFETTHDLGRVVDKFSIKVLREEFERAAEILQFDPNPCVTLFEPYVPS